MDATRSLDGKTVGGVAESGVGAVKADAAEAQSRRGPKERRLTSFMALGAPGIGREPPRWLSPRLGARLPGVPRSGAASAIRRFNREAGSSPGNSGKIHRARMPETRKVPSRQWPNRPCPLASTVERALR